MLWALTTETDHEDMRDLEDQRSTKHSEALPKDIKDRCHLSSTWAVWAPGLRAAIREALHRHLKREGDETAGEEPHLAKMTSEEAWEAHIRQGHIEGIVGLVFWKWVQGLHIGGDAMLQRRHGR